MRKRLLIIGMDFRTYEPNIVEACKKLGYDVEHISDAPKTLRGYDTFVPEWIKRKHQAHYQKKIINTLRTYDIVLVFVGRHLHPFFLEQLRAKSPDARFVLYLWDDVLRVENFDIIKGYFDEIVSFELNDCAKYGFRFVPLYYMPEYVVKDAKKEFDVCTISGNHSDRFILIHKLLDKYSEVLKFDMYLVDGHIPYYKYCLSGKKKKDLKRGLSYTDKPKSIEETAQIMSRSRAILDMQHSTQKGLTNRTIEALGAQIKLITANEQVQYYDFYDPENIMIINREDPVIDLSFFETEYKPIPKEIYDKYSLTSWLKEILEDSGATYLTCSVSDFA